MTDEPPAIAGPPSRGSAFAWGAVAALGGLAAFVLPPVVLPRPVPEPPYGHPLIPWLAKAMANMTVVPTAGAFFVLGIVLGAAQPRRRLWMAVASVSLLMALHVVNIAGDVHVDPTDHNLLPFEFALLGGIALPVLPGVWLGAFVRRKT